MEFRKILIILVAILCRFYCNPRKVYNLSHVANVLQEESKGNQVLLLHHNKSKNEEIFQFGKQILMRIPTRVADYRNEMEAHRQKMTQPEDHFQTTTVVVISSQNDYETSSTLSKLMTSIANLSNPKQCPKVLIITQVQTKRIRYEHFLKFLWSKQFLDVTILDLRLQDNCRKKLTECFQTFGAYQHNYNPFTGTCYRTSFLESGRFFPNKLHDLNGYKLNVYFFNYPPYLMIKRNSSGHIANIYGPDANLVNTYSEVMNFTINTKIGKGSNWIKVKCSEETFLNTFGGNDFLAVQSSLAKTCWDNYIDTSKGTRMNNYAIAVPTLSEKLKIHTEWNLMKLMNIIFLILIPNMMSRFLKFNLHYWQIMYTIRIILGFPIPQEPKRNVERIMFIIMWTFLFLQSSFIFTTLSSLQWQKVVFKKIESLDDIRAANLTLILHGYIGPDRDDLQSLLNTGRHTTESLEKCVKMLMDYQNVTCWGRIDSTRLIIGKHRNSYNETRVEILNKWSNLLPSILFLMRGLPYKCRFESITSILIESGISDMWDASLIPKKSFLQNRADLYQQETLLSSKSIYLMISFLSLGYLGSIIIFAVEIIIRKCLQF